MKTIKFTVRHGDTNETITGTGADIPAAIADLQNHPLGAGYAITPDRESFGGLIADLAINHNAQWGWGDYEVCETPNQ